MPLACIADGTCYASVMILRVYPFGVPFRARDIGFVPTIKGANKGTDTAPPPKTQVPRA
jgi:hypothetical protein